MCYNEYKQYDLVKEGDAMLSIKAWLIYNLLT